MTEPDPLAVLLARREIDDALARYCRGVDRGDPELVASVFHDDADVDTGLHAVASGTEPEFASFSLFHHQLGQQVAQVNGDSAATETYFSAAQRFVLDGVEYDQQMRGRYLDRWERRGGPFRISFRRLVWDWARTEPASPTWPDGSILHWGGRRIAEADLYWGARSRDDPSYQLFGMPPVRWTPGG